MQLALIDGDVIAYAAASLCETIWDEGDTPDVDLKKGYGIVRNLLAHWTQAAGCYECRVALSDRTGPRTSFRYRIHPNYKNTRTQPKPVALPDVEDYLRRRHGAEYIQGLEGDDLLGIWATTPGVPNCVVVSRDKDMLTIPAKIFIVPHMRPMEYGYVEKITPNRSRWNWMYQTLIGDTVDNYKGCPGIGPKKARDILSNAHQGGLWQAVLEAYEERYELPHWGHRFLTDDPFQEALLNARCARILQYGDYENGQVHLWSPKGHPKEIIDVRTPD